MPGHDWAMRASFLIEGEGIPTGTDLGSIDMRDVAPASAALLGTRLPQAQGRALFAQLKD